MDDEVLAQHKPRKNPPVFDPHLHHLLPVQPHLLRHVHICLWVGRASTGQIDDNRQPQTPQKHRHHTQVHYMMDIFSSANPD